MNKSLTTQINSECDLDQIELSLNIFEFSHKMKSTNIDPIYAYLSAVVNSILTLNIIHHKWVLHNSSLTPILRMKVFLNLKGMRKLGLLDNEIKEERKITFYYLNKRFYLNYTFF